MLSYCERLTIARFSIFNLPDLFILTTMAHSAQLSAIRPPKAFTLLELLVVLAIMGLLAAVAVIRLQGPLRDARMDDVVQRIAFTDGQVRFYSQRFACPTRLVYDLDENSVYAESDMSDGVRHFHFALPDTLRVARVRTVRGDSGRGKTTIEVTSDGHTPTYAVRLDSSDQRTRWLLFAGLTGQVIRLKAEADVQELLGLVVQ